MQPEEFNVLEIEEKIGFFEQEKLNEKNKNSVGFLFRPSDT